MAPKPKKKVVKGKVCVLLCVFACIYDHGRRRLSLFCSKSTAFTTALLLFCSAALRCILDLVPTSPTPVDNP